MPQSPTRPPATGSTAPCRSRGSRMRGWRGSTGRSAGGCSSCPAGGRRRSPPMRRAGLIPTPGISSSSWSAPSPCAAPAAPITTSSTATSTPSRAYPLAADPERPGQRPPGQGLPRRPGAGRPGRPAPVQPLRHPPRLRLAGDRRGLSLPEAGHRLAAARPRHRLLLGRADGLGGGVRPARSGRRSSSISAASPGRSATTRSTPTRTGGRRAGRRPLHRAAVRRADEALSRRRSTGSRRSSSPRPSSLPAPASLPLSALRLGAAHLAWQVATLRTDDPDNCLRVFRSNRDYGLILFAGLVADCWLTATP